MQNTLYQPKEAAKLLRMSVGTISRCVKLGAPVHRWGSTGHRYLIDIDEFRNWMESRGEERRKSSVVHSRKASTRSAEEMAEIRHQMMAALRRKPSA